MNQPAAPKKGSEKTYYIAPKDDNEQAIAQAWLAKHCPNVNTPGNPRFVTELRIDRLTDEHCVRVLARTKKMTPALMTERESNGLARVVKRDVESLADEIVEGPAIECRKHWLERSDHEEGELIVSSFLEALGKSSTPYSIKWRPDDGRKLWLGWA